MKKEPEYDLESMKQALVKCDENIKVFEAAIIRERETKAEYERIILTLQSRASHPTKIRIDVKNQEIFPHEGESYTPS